MIRGVNKIDMVLLAFGARIEEAFESFSEFRRTVWNLNVYFCAAWALIVWPFGVFAAFLCCEHLYEEERGKEDPDSRPWWRVGINIMAALVVQLCWSTVFVLGMTLIIPSLQDPMRFESIWDLLFVIWSTWGVFWIIGSLVEGTKDKEIWRFCN